MKWPISDDNVPSPQELQAAWVSQHEGGYDENVWSVTKDPFVRAKVLSELITLGARRILVPGCGSEVDLQNTIAASVPGVVEILCVDFGPVVEIANSKPNHPVIKYEGRSFVDFRWDGEWDAVVIVNSVISGSDRENREALEKCQRALCGGGSLIGFFPTIFAALDIAFVDCGDALSQDFRSRINLERSSFHETKQRMEQIFYTPLRLRVALMEARLRLKKMELFFCDSQYFLDEARYYGITDPDRLVYELFVVAQKASSPSPKT